MKAYNQTWVENIDNQSIIKDWHEKKLLTDEQMQAAKAEHPVEFYRPNWFIRIGLFIFTLVVASFASSFFSLIFFGFDSQIAISIFCFIIGIVFVFLLEFFIKNRRVYRSGLDNALLYSAIGSIYSGFLIAFGFEISTWFYPLFLLVLLIPAIIRYADPILSFVAFGCFYAFAFLISIEFPIGKLILPFVIMILSAIIYFLSKKQKSDSYYADSQSVVEVLALMFFYLGGNYLVVREANAMLNDASQSAEIAFSWLFWIFTFAIPILYLFMAAKHKDRKLLFVGLLAFGFSIYTYRFYHQIMPLEWALTLGGAILVAFSIWAINYFKTEKHGLTYQADKSDKLQNLEAFIFSQTIPNTPQSNATNFGGGDFGGGGAGGNL